MGQCYKKIKHEACGSSDALQVFVEDGKYNGWCYRCNTYVANPLGDQEPDDEVMREIEESQQDQLAEIESLNAVTIGQRRLHSLTLEHFEAKVAVSQEDGETPQVLYCPLYKGDTVSGYSAKLLYKKEFWRVGNTKEAEPFGLKQAIESGSKKLYVTEGEVDAMSVWQALKVNSKNTKWANQGIAVISLPNGAGSAKKCFATFGAKFKQYFQEIVLVFDKDDAGQEAIRDALIVVPDCKVAHLPAKDANECLIKNLHKGLVNALLFKVDEHKKSKAVEISNYFERAMEPPTFGFSFPWPTLTAATRGMRLGELWMVGAGVKMGKTELAYSVASHFIEEHNFSVYIANLEESNVKTTRKMVGKIARKMFHDPSKEFDTGAFNEAKEKLRDKVFFCDHFQNATWEELKQDIIAEVQLHGVKLVMIDPITNLTNNADNKTVDTMLRSISQDMATLCRDLNICMWVFCHCKAPVNAKPHEAGGKVFSNQFTGSRAMIRSANYVLALEGDKSDELEEHEKNTRLLRILDDREYGVTAKLQLFWNSNTSVFEELT